MTQAQAHKDTAAPEPDTWATRFTDIKKAWIAAERENNTADETRHTTYDDTVDRLMHDITIDQNEAVYRWAKSRRYLG